MPSLSFQLRNELAQSSSENASSQDVLELKQPAAVEVRKLLAEAQKLPAEGEEPVENHNRARFAPVVLRNPWQDPQDEAAVELLQIGDRSAHMDALTRRSV